MLYVAVVNRLSLFFRYNYFKRDSDIEKFNFDLKEYSGNLFLPCLMYTDSAKSCFKKILPAIHNTNGRLTTRVGNSEHLLGILQKWKSSGIHLMSTGNSLNCFNPLKAKSTFGSFNRSHLLLKPLDTW